MSSAPGIIYNLPTELTDDYTWIVSPPHRSFFSASLLEVQSMATQHAAGHRFKVRKVRKEIQISKEGL
eukprot:scaffold5047_cov127-Skeletonema_menzelii.AAC.12